MKRVSRRDVLQTIALTAALSAVAAHRARAAGAPAEGAAEPKLEEQDPQALALGYVENAARVDAKKYPSFVQGSNCENCLKLEGKAPDEYRPCTLFPGKRVAITGWCSAWTAEM
jgi:hypothetical protein